MVSQTNEQALESTIEQYLTGTCLENLKTGLTATQLQEPKGSYSQGYHLGLAKNFNATYALDEQYFWQFLNHTQAKELEKLKKHSPHDWQLKILERFNKLGGLKSTVCYICSKKV